MAIIVPVLGEQLLVQVSNGASPEVYSAPALINTTRGVTISTATETEELIELTDQSLPAVTARFAKSVDYKIDGAGMLSKGDVKAYLDWAKSGLPKNIKVTDAATGASWTMTGPFLLTQFQLSGERRKAATCQISLEASGPVTIA